MFVQQKLSPHQSFLYYIPANLKASLFVSPLTNVIISHENITFRRRHRPSKYPQ